VHRPFHDPPPAIIHDNPVYASRLADLHPTAAITINKQPKWFASIDTDKSGQLNAKELQKALALGNLNFSLTDVDHMVRAFDATQSRTLGFDEFQRLHNFLVNVQGSFRTFDRDRSGKLSTDEINSALKQAGFALDGPAVAAMIERFDPEGTRSLSLDGCGEKEGGGGHVIFIGRAHLKHICTQHIQNAPTNILITHKITLTQPKPSFPRYIRACLFLQTAARTFAAFDPERKGTVTTNFSQFCYCCAHVSG
jgi:Ca2+-binding EF-hand superfamily protein